MFVFKLPNKLKFSDLSVQLMLDMRTVQMTTTVAWDALPTLTICLWHQTTRRTLRLNVSVSLSMCLSSFRSYIKYGLYKCHFKWLIANFKMKQHTCISISCNALLGSHHVSNVGVCRKHTRTAQIHHQYVYQIASK